jgi:hypothetical protein
MDTHRNLPVRSTSMTTNERPTNPLCPAWASHLENAMERLYPTGIPSGDREADAIVRRAALREYADCEGHGIGPAVEASPRVEIVCQAFVTLVVEADGSVRVEVPYNVQGDLLDFVTHVEVDGTPAWSPEDEDPPTAAADEQYAAAHKVASEALAAGNVPLWLFFDSQDGGYSEEART